MTCEFHLGIKNQWWIIKHKNDKLDFIKIKKSSYIKEQSQEDARQLETSENVFAISYVLKVCNPEYTDNSCQSTRISSQKIQLKIRENELKTYFYSWESLINSYCN